jgi:DNA repair protein RecO (recombination protein O)
LFSGRARLDDGDPDGIIRPVPLRERTYRTEAVVLRRKDFGEADRVLTLFTPDLGKVRVVAKGIRKPRSRKAGHLELFTCSRLLMAKGRDLDLITQAETVNAYRPLREDLLRGAYAAYAVELLDKFTPDAEENRELYGLLKEALGWLAVTDDLALTARYYELHLLSLAGFQPQLYRCVVGGEAIVAEDQFFSVVEGGAVCARCGTDPAKAPPGIFPISTEALKYLRYLQSNPYAKVSALKVRSSAQAEMEYVMARYITATLERQLKSAEFLRLIRRENLLAPHEIHS